MTRSIEARVSVAENDIEGLQKDTETMQNTLKSILDSVQEIEKKMIGNTKFFAGMCFAYGSIGVAFGGLIMAGFNYLVHKA